MNSGLLSQPAQPTETGLQFKGETGMGLFGGIAKFSREMRAHGIIIYL